MPTIETVMGGKATCDDLIEAGSAELDGDRKPLDVIRSALVRFVPDFELVPGTTSEKVTPPGTHDPFEAEPPADTSGG